MSTTIEKIQRQIAESPILLYMKGSPKLPSCGFSAQNGPGAYRMWRTFLPMLIFCRIRTFVRNCRHIRAWPLLPATVGWLTASWWAVVVIS